MYIRDNFGLNICLFDSIKILHLLESQKLKLMNCCRILRVLCRNLTLSSEFDYESIAKNTPGYVGADLTALTREAAMLAVNRYEK